MEIFRRSSARKWHPLWKPVPFFVFCVLFFGYRAVTESRVAAREQTSFGIVGECEQRGRGNDTYCHYTFPAAGEQYLGVSRAALGTRIGATVVVFYDSLDPGVSALADYSEQSRTDRRWVYVFLVLLAGTVSFITWRGAARRGSPG